MSYKLNGLTVNENNENVLVEIANHTFATKEEALTFIKANISLQSHNEPLDILVLVVDGINYHYTELVQVSE